MQCCAVQCCAVQCNAVQCFTMQCSVVLFSAFYCAAHVVEEVPPREQKGGRWRVEGGGWKVEGGRVEVYFLRKDGIWFHGHINPTNVSIGNSMKSCWTRSELWPNASSKVSPLLLA